MTIEQLQERKTKLEAQRAQLIEDANRHIAALDGAIALALELIAELEATADSD